MQVSERAIRSALAEAVSGLAPAGGDAHGRWRVRLCVNAEGLAEATGHRIELTPNLIQTLMLAGEPVSSGDESLRLKTTRRGVYERMSASVPVGVEALLWNSSGYVTESSIANLVYKMDGCLYTPPVSDGLLPGVLRGILIEKGELEERSLPVSDLCSVEALYLVNALRGWRNAALVPRTGTPDNSKAESAPQVAF